MSRSVIAIAGAKGSPGCSFLAVALTRCLAANKIETLLLDGDAEGGGLGTLLDVDPVMQARAVEGDAIDDAEIRIDEWVSFAEVEQTADTPINGLELVGAARARHQAVVIDLGHSTGQLQRQLSAASDWLLWVVVPDRSGLDRADRALESAALGAANVGLVFNRISPACLDHAEDVLSSRHRLPVLGRINEDRRIAERLSQGLPVHRERGLRRTLLALAGSIYPESMNASRAWQ